MKAVKCKSGLKGWQDKLQNVYGSLKEFREYCRNYGIHTRLGYWSAKEAWESNPTIQGSTDPTDLAKVYFHLIVSKNGLRIKEVANWSVVGTKGSRAAFETREGAIAQLNNIELK